MKCSTPTAPALLVLTGAGGNLGNLQPLCWAPRTADVSDLPVPARFGLVNTRLLANKTFILKDFFTSWELDFLFVTETWLNVGESSAFTEFYQLIAAILSLHGHLAEEEE